MISSTEGLSVIIIVIIIIVQPKDYQDFDDANEACRLSEFLGVELKGSQVKQIKSMSGCSDLH